MALTKVIGAGLGTLTEDQVLGGATPTLTIGDAGAEDAKIVFDGNAQDFHIGLDDSTDSLTIGLGSALGTTTHMKFDSTGCVTKPLQPAFHATPSSTQTNLSNATTIAFGTERFDQNGDFASNTFTAPVTGKYQINVSIGLLDTDSAAAFIGLALISSNKAYYILVDPDYGQDNAYGELALHQLIDMDANDTVYVNFLQNGGTAQTDVHEDHSNFSGYLVA